jgi:hypothetical protein
MLTLRSNGYNRALFLIPLTNASTSTPPSRGSLLRFAWRFRVRQLQVIRVSSNLYMPAEEFQQHVQTLLQDSWSTENLQHLRKRTVSKSLAGSLAKHFPWPKFSPETVDELAW